MLSPPLFVGAHFVGARGATVHVCADQNLVACQPQQETLLLNQGSNLDIDNYQVGCRTVW